MSVTPSIKSGGYLRLLLCDEDETVVVDEVAVDILPKG